MSLKLIRTKKGLQWAEDFSNAADASKPATVRLPDEETASMKTPDSAFSISAAGGWGKLISIAKDLLPWIVLVVQMIYSFGVKSSTSDRTQQQQMEDHIAVGEVREKLSTLTAQQATFAGKLDMLVSISLKDKK